MFNKFNKNFRNNNRRSYNDRPRRPAPRRRVKTPPPVFQTVLRDIATGHLLWMDPVERVLSIRNDVFTVFESRKKAGNALYRTAMLNESFPLSEIKQRFTKENFPNNHTNGKRAVWADSGE